MASKEDRQARVASRQAAFNQFKAVAIARGYSETDAERYAEMCCDAPRGHIGSRGKAVNENSTSNEGGNSAMHNFKTVAEADEFVRKNGKGKLQPGDAKRIVELKAAELKAKPNSSGTIDLTEGRVFNTSDGVRGMGQSHDAEESAVEGRIRNWLRLGLSAEEAREVANLPMSAMKEAARKLGLSESEAASFAMLCHSEENPVVQGIIAD